MKFRPLNEDGMPDIGPRINVKYTNYRGVTAVREISPVGLWYGSTEWHEKLCWLLHCYDWGKGDWRDYALADCDFASPT